MTDKPKPKRRWLQFSLRTLLIFVTVFCLCLGILGITVKRARDQRMAVEAILAIGGTVTYENGEIRRGVSQSPQSRFRLLQWGPRKPPRPPGLEWLRNFFGDEYFYRVESVKLVGPKVTDATLEAVGRLTDVKWLNLRQTEVTKGGLEHLKELTNLQSLSIENTRVTDAGMEHMKGLTKLRSLSLRNTGITDAGLEHLTGLTNLVTLSLKDTQITDAGLEHLKGLTKLERLLLLSTDITDAGLEHLKGLTNLRSIKLLLRTQVTDEGVKKLKQALPYCRITRP